MRVLQWATMVVLTLSAFVGCGTSTGPAALAVR